MVLTMVTEAFSASALPFSTQSVALPGVENVTPIEAMMVPTMVPPPEGLIVAALPTCQNTFLACAPLIRSTLRGTAESPTVNELAVWNTQTAVPRNVLLINGAQAKNVFRQVGSAAT